MPFETMNPSSIARQQRSGSSRNRRPVGFISAIAGTAPIAAAAVAFTVVQQVLGPIGLRVEDLVDGGARKIDRAEATLESADEAAAAAEHEGADRAWHPPG